ncbi:helicase-associated domain-containing protein (plasmid) [Kitasatospora griseola]|uniref:helicase-associated domain-containing protein n=1 Tax=Kitasatospora griseola TaxID=2064 RepID=UPI003855F032
MKEQIASLQRLLAAMDGRERAALLAVRPTALQQPRPRTLRQLAARLLGTARLSHSALDLGEQQLLEAAVAAADHTRRPGLPPQCERAYLESLVGVGAAVTAQRFAEVLHSLTAKTLAWPDGDLVLIHPDTTALFPTALGRAAHGRPSMPAAAPLTPDAPAPELRPAAGDGHGSGAAALHYMDKLLGAFADPWPALKSGGLSVRDVRRLARLLHCTEEEARLWLHLAVNLDLLAERWGRWIRTERAPAWTRTPPADRLAYLAVALDSVQLLSGLTTQDPKLLNQFAPYPAGPHPHYSAAKLRHAVLHVLADLPDGQAAADGPALTATVHYRSPRLFEPYDPAAEPVPPRSDPFGYNQPKPHVAEVTTAVLREAELLALTDQGALTPLGRAFLHDPHGYTALRAAAADALPLQETAAILADHSVLVTGTPSSDLAALLRDACEPEFRDVRTETWRITPGSVRAYFDQRPGGDPKLLLDALATRSSTPLPQTVTYLVTDTAARHGHITVAKAGTVLDVRDQALAAELAHHRDLAGLQLRQAGPTVLLSPLQPGPVLDALRTAGYAPAGQHKPPTNQADDRVDAPYEPPQILLPRQRRRPAFPAADSGEWLADLPADAHEPAGELARFIHGRAPSLGADDCNVLATAINAGPGSAVHVEYRTPARTHATAAVRGPQLDHLHRLTSETGRTPMPLSLNSLQLVLPLPNGRKRTPRST